MSLGVVERRISGVVVLDVMGRMLIEEGGAVCDYVLTHLGHHDRTLLVNLHNVAYIDSTGIADLIACHRLITDQGGRLYLTHLQPHVHELLDQSGLLRIFTTFADERAAIASLRRRPPEDRSAGGGALRPTRSGPSTTWPSGSRSANGRSIAC